MTVRELYDRLVFLPDGRAREMYEAALQLWEQHSGNELRQGISAKFSRSRQGGLFNDRENIIIQPLRGTGKRKRVSIAHGAFSFSSHCLWYPNLFSKAVRN